MKNSLISSKKNKNKTRISIGYLEGFISIILNILLFLLKLWVGVQTFSIAIIADAWHTLSDSLSSVAVLIGLRASKKPPDEEHPYGHGRAELVSTLLIGLVLALIGVNFLRESIDRLINHEAVIFGFWAKVVTIISIVAKEGLAQLSFFAARILCQISILTRNEGVKNNIAPTIKTTPYPVPVM